MTEPKIRGARPTLADATALLAVEGQSLGDSSYTPEQVLSILQRPEHFAYLASVGGTAVGFCSCFETPTGNGHRLEIDMLGVVPDYRQQGLGTCLIAHSMAEARRRSLQAFRAVVSVDNVSSQRAFRRAGLEPSSHAFDMVVYEIRGLSATKFLPEGWSWHIAQEGTWPAWLARLANGQADRRMPDQPLHTFNADGCGHEVHWLEDGEASVVAIAECLKVHTVAYEGLWIEKLAADSARSGGWIARAVVERAKSLSLDEVGYLVPSSGKEDIRLSWTREGFLIRGAYYVFTAERV